MPKIALLPEHVAALCDVAKCSNCGSRMTLGGQNYVCPNNTKKGSNHCSTGPVNGDMLVRKVITQSLKKALTDRNIKELVGDVRETLQLAALMQQERLRAAERTVEELNRRKEKLLLPMKRKFQADPQAAEQAHKLDAEITGFAYESHIARKEIDKLDFITDENGLVQVARDPATFLDHADPRDTRDLVNLFIQNVLIGARSVEIIYAITMQDPDKKDMVASDLLVLD